MYVEGNRLIDSLSLPVRNELLSCCKFGLLPIGASLYQPDERVRYVHFLLSGMASVVLPTAEGASAELLLIGREGMAGGTKLLGPANLPAACSIQVEAEAYRIRFDDLNALFHRSTELRTRLLEYLQHGSFFLCQIAACNRLHRADQRLARWLLVAQDRLRSPTFCLTQEFLAELLSVQRTTVTGIIGALSGARLIEHRRSQITILNRAQLEASACSCFPKIHSLWRDLYKLPYLPR